MATSATIDQIRKITDHDRAEISWVLAATLDDNGKPTIARIARITRVWPKDGMGRLRVAVQDFGPDGKGYPCAMFTGYASGCGYDKTTAALDGATIGGVTIGDHCDSEKHPTLAQLAHSKGWELFGNLG